MAKASETSVWQYLDREINGHGVHMERVEVKYPLGIADIHFIAGNVSAAFEFKKNLGSVRVIEGRSLESRIGGCGTEGWIELKLVKLEEVVYTRRYDYGLRKEQALWLNSWWRYGGLSWTLLGVIDNRGKWDRFILTSGKYAYRILRKISLPELEQISTVFHGKIEPHDLAKSLCNRD